MRKTKQVTALVIAAVLVLTGCGGNGKTGGAGSEGDKGQTQSEAGGGSQSGSGSQDGGGAQSGGNSQSGGGQNGSGSQSGGQLKDSLSVALKAEPGNIDPHGNTQLVSFAIQREIFNTLVQKDENGNIVPELAESWEVLDDTTIRFHLRDDVYFHNGEKMTAEDVRFSIARATEGKGSKTLFVNFDGENTKVVDDTTVDIKLKAPFAAALNYLTSSRGDILSKKAVEELGDEEFGRQPVGTGPFKFKEWKSGVSVELERNEEYWGEKPSYSKLTFKFITEAANRAIELETGGVDIAYDISPNDVSRLEDSPECQIVQGQGYKFTYITLNMQDEYLKNQKVREALSIAVDMPSLVDAVYSGTAVVADSVMNPNMFGYVSIGQNEYNVEKAKTLLAEAGYPDGFTISMKTNDDKQFIAVLEIVQNMWKEIGVTGEIQSYEQASYLDMAKAGEVQVGMSSTTATTGDPDNALFYLDQGYKGHFQPNDDKIAGLLADGRGEYDESKRAAVYEELEHYIWDQHYMIPVCYTNVIYGTGKNVENLPCDPGTTPDLSKVNIYEK